MQMESDMNQAKDAGKDAGAPAMSDVTHILAAVRAGDDAAAERLFELVYAELRRVAVQKMAHESAGHTLQPTALVHEAWLFREMSGRG